MIKDSSIFLEGNSTGILLIHGLGGTPIELKSMAKKLNQDGFTVLCPQLYGHCSTVDDLKKSTANDWLESAQQALIRLNSICKKIIVGGLSMGGLLGLRLAYKNQNLVTGIILLAPTIWHDGWAVPQRDFFIFLLKDTPMGRKFHFVENWPYGLKDENRREAVLRAMKSGNSAEAGIQGTPAQSLIEFWKIVNAVKTEVKSINKPTLIIHAREDDISSLKNVEYLQKNLIGLVETVILNDSYHLITLDKQRDIVFNRTSRFAKQIEENQ